MNKLETLFVKNVGVSFFKIFSLLITLFFLWGFSLGLSDVLNRHFQELIEPNSLKYSFVLLAYYAGYFIMPLPASIFAERFGYKNGIILGLMLFAFGSFMFFPTSQFHSFPLFIFSLFAIALGMAALETVVNPYATLIGKNNYSTFRITLGHSFTSLGWLFGPFVGGSILFDVHEQVVTKTTTEFASMSVPYVGIGILVLLLAILILISDLPKIRDEKLKSITLKNPQYKSISIYKRRYFITAVITMFFYVAAQTAIFGFYTKYLFDLFKSMDNQVIGNGWLLKIIHFVGNSNDLNDRLYHSVATLIFTFMGMGLFTVGRFVGSFILIKFKPNVLLVLSSIFSFFFSIVLWLDLVVISFVALCLITLSISTMFPVIFSLGIRKMGYKTKRASAHIIMAIVGGSSYPILVGVLPTINPVSIGLTILFISFILTFIYGYSGYKIDDKIRPELKL